MSAAEDLAAERSATQARIAALEAQVAAIVETASSSSGDDEHDPEGQTVAYERAQTQALLRRARADLAEVDAAFGRLDAGTYGICEVCGRPIPGERLEARPTARRCVRHA
ncbi:TraR/DksA family transcriptional regulator [Actinomycetospora sp. TBRC 11914]|uniref:TraR/DksA family transcriptional regulator n=1 Tax=Actinomycetospora sp. TBRC 11914 TaxID=2729387 RepID=UPI00145D4881|nr:TraR/DksA C4-type zinc finger protein [Actinomycetospora sp. TBRC 11914]NMO93945.1 TraR/DksA family transcriptional regulator [Actinomycetospora sp. TBRC 11914]